jgi:hypothetical protein
VRTSPRILLYPHSARAFSSTLIGHLYELAQQYAVVLLAEPLPQPYLDLLARRDLFPGLERVEIVHGLGFTLRDLLANNRRWQRMAEEAIVSFTPDLVVTENDMSALFDMYLLRAAKRRGIRRLTIQGMGQFQDRRFRRFARLMAIHVDGQLPSSGVASLRAARFHAKKELGHLLVHYALPLAAGQGPLGGRSSYVRHTGAPGMRDSQLHLVLSAQQYGTFVDSGVAPRRLGILAHPLERVPPEAFFPETPTFSGDRKRALVLLGPLSLGFDRETSELISRERRRATRLAALRQLKATLPGWEIVLKAHPDFGPREQVRRYVQRLGPGTVIVDPRWLVEPLLPACDLVIDLPPATTSTLVTAASDPRHIPVMAADLDHDLLGDQYCGWPGINYVNDCSALERTLQQIASGTYSRPPRIGMATPTREFRSTTEAVQHLLVADPR